jgi:hypothetical protein
LGAWGRSYRPFSGIARRLGNHYNVVVQASAAKEKIMKLRLTASPRVERDDRVLQMLDRHVRSRHGSAPLISLTQPLGLRIAIATIRR